MNTNTYNTPELANFTVNRDGLPDEDYLPAKVPVFTHFTAGLSAFGESIRLELALIAYDRIHGTQYRSIRKSLVSAKRNEAFEQRIGLVKR